MSNSFPPSSGGLPKREWATKRTRGKEREGRQRPFLNVWTLGLFAIFLLSILVYWPSLSGEAIWDDHAILNGTAIGGGTLEGAITKPFLTNYRPGGSLSFLLDRAIYGQDIFGYHTTNVLLHAMGAMIAAWLGLLLFQSVASGLAAGLLFAVQPSQVGAVAWVGGRVDALSVVLVGLFVGWLLLYSRDPKRHWLALSCLAFVAALFVKETNVLAVLLVPVALARSGWRNAMRACLPHAAGIAIFAVCWLIYHPGLNSPRPVSFGETLIRAEATVRLYLLTLTGFDHDSLFTFSLVDYEGKSVKGWWLLLLMVLGLATAWRARSPVALAVCGLLVTYLPASNLVPIPSLLVGPYRVAVPGMFCALLASALMMEFEKGPRSKWPWMIGTVGYLFGLSAWATLSSIPGWSSELRFFSEVAKRDPHSITGQWLYSGELLQADRPKEALHQVEKTLDWIYGSDLWRRIDTLKSYTNDDSAAYRRIRSNTGVARNPGYDVASLLYNRASAQESLGELDGSFLSLQLAEYVEPRHPDVLAALGDHYLNRDRSLAIRYYERSVEAGPNNWENLRRLAKQRLVDGRLDESIRLYRRVVALAPLASIAWYEMSVALEQQGKIDEAVMAMEEGLKGFTFDREGFEKRIEELKKVRGR